MDRILLSLTAVLVFMNAVIYRDWQLLIAAVVIVSVVVRMTARGRKG